MQKKLLYPFYMVAEKYFAELQLIIDYVESNLTSGITVSEVCSLGRFSTWESQRLFRAHTGDTVGNYIWGRRLTKAAEKLLEPNTNRNILDIAIEFQFGSQEAFSRAFKAQFGVTPGQMRKEGTKRLSSIKPLLNSKRLRHIAEKISKTPDIQVLPARSLMGRSTKINSTLGSENDSYELVKKHWVSFFRDFPNTSRDEAYGLIFGSDATMNDERLNYVASISATLCNDISLSRYELPEQLYAVFEVKAQKQSCHLIADYIYGVWLPESDYQRAEGYDFELLNFVKSEVVRYHIPIKMR